MAFAETIYRTAADWVADNQTLELGQIGVESDIRNGVQYGTMNAKLGDGMTAWNSLGYWSPLPPTVLFKGLTSSNSTSATTMSISSLVISVEALTSYVIEINLLADNSEFDLKYDLDGGTCSASGLAIYWSQFGTNGVLSAGSRLTSLSADFSGVVNSDDSRISATGVINISDAGLLALRFGLTSDSEIGGSLLSGSSIKLTKIS